MRMPLAATKSKYGKNLQVLHFDPDLPLGAGDVSEVDEEPIDERFVTGSSPKL